MIAFPEFVETKVVCVASPFVRLVFHWSVITPTTKRTDVKAVFIFELIMMADRAHMSDRLVILILEVEVGIFLDFFLVVSCLIFGQGKFIKPIL